MEHSEGQQVPPVEEQPLVESAILSIQIAGSQFLFPMPSMQALKDKARQMLTHGFVELESPDVYLFVTKDSIAFVGMPHSAYVAQQQQAAAAEQAATRAAANKPATPSTRLVY